MAEGAKAPASVEGIFGVLAQIPQDRLASYECKLNHRQRDLRLCRLLRIMILLTLKREAEARRSLDALGYDLVAARIYRSHRGSGKASKADPVPPEQEAEVAWAVAQIYALLADEKLCDPRARNEAYRAAVRAFQDSRPEAAQLQTLLEEGREKCGEGFAPVLSGGHREGLAADPGRSPLLPASAAQPSLDPHSLRSTGTPLSFVSHFEISPATTVPGVRGPDREPGAETGKVGRSSSAPLGTADDEEGGQRSPANLWPCSPEESPTKYDRPKEGSNGDFKRAAPLPGPVEPRVTQPVEGDAQHSPERSLPRNLETLSVLQPGFPNPAESAESSSPRAWTPEAAPRGSPAAALLLPLAGSSPGDQSQFFSFVVLHAGEDEAIACRVKRDLEEMGVPDGATYSEDFLVPGRCQLGCFQDALDNSAFTLLLLTQNFGSRFCAYQTSVALMDSFRRFCKTNTVIPFIPKENPLPQSAMPTVLVGLVPLNENSPVYRRRVRKTFAAGAIREKAALWRARKEVQERQRLQRREREYQEMLRHLSQLGADAPPPAPPAGFPGCQRPPPGPDQPSFSQPFLVSLGSGGPQPQFIIQHAQMIQIGDYNCMQAERTGAAEEDVRED